MIVSFRLLLSGFTLYTGLSGMQFKTMWMSFSQCDLNFPGPSCSLKFLTSTQSPGFNIEYLTTLSCLFPFELFLIVCSLSISIIHCTRPLFHISLWLSLVFSFVTTKHQIYRSSWRTTEKYEKWWETGSIISRAIICMYNFRDILVPSFFSDSLAVSLAWTKAFY